MNSITLFSFSSLCLLGTVSAESPQEVNTLDGASCSLFVPANSISALDQWGTSREVWIGVDLHNSKNFNDLDAGLMVVVHPHLTEAEFVDTMTTVAFEVFDEASIPQELVAERDPLNRPTGQCLGTHPE